MAIDVTHPVCKLCIRQTCRHFYLHRFASVFLSVPRIMGLFPAIGKIGNFMLILQTTEITCTCMHFDIIKGASLRARPVLVQASCIHCQMPILLGAILQNSTNWGVCVSPGHDVVVVAKV